MDGPENAETVKPKDTPEPIVEPVPKPITEGVFSPEKMTALEGVAETYAAKIKSKGHAERFLTDDKFALDYITGDKPKVTTGEMAEAIAGDFINKNMLEPGEVNLGTVELLLKDADGNIIGGSLREIDNVLVSENGITRTVSVKHTASKSAVSKGRSADLQSIQELTNLPESGPGLRTELESGRFGNIRKVAGKAEQAVVHVNGVEMTLSEFRSQYIKGEPVTVETLTPNPKGRSDVTPLNIDNVTLEQTTIRLTREKLKPK